MADPVHYFSNGSEAEEWFARNCDGCRHDADQDCPHVLAMLTSEPDPQLARTGGGRLVCSARDVPEAGR